jgi:hypothetical protein
VVCWCSPRGVLVFAAWCAGVRRVVCWCSPRGVLVFAAWCAVTPSSGIVLRNPTRRATETRPYPQAAVSTF